MSLSTLFISPRFIATPDKVDDPMLGSMMALFGKQISHNVLWKQVMEASLAAVSDTQTVTLNGLALSDWVILIVKCVGSARINTTGKDFDGTTSISGKLPVYGTSIVPGLAVISTYNLSAITVEALATNTVVEIFACIAAEDDDARLTTYA